MKKPKLSIAEQREEILEFVDWLKANIDIISCSFNGAFNYWKENIKSKPTNDNKSSSSNPQKIVARPNDSQK